MISYKIFPFSFLSLILFCNCSDPKDPCEETKHYYFFVKPEEKAVLPYKGFDTLRLKHSSGTEYTFYAGAIDSLFTISTKATSPDCANNIIQHMQSFLTKFKFQLNTDYDIHYNMYIPSYYSSSSLVSVIFQKHQFEFDTDFDQFPVDNTTLYDSLDINGLFYSHVKKTASKSTLNNYLFYNSKHGILKFVLSNGETWERIP